MTIGKERAPEPAPVLFVGCQTSVFVVRTAEALEQRGLRVEILDPREDLPYEFLARLGPLGGALSRYLGMRRRLREIESRNVAVIHGLGTDTAWLVPLLKPRFKRVVGVAYGSDILRRRRSRDWVLKPAFAAMDHISATNDNVLDSIKDSFPGLHTGRLSITRFGLPVIDELRNVVLPAGDPERAKKSLGLDSKKVTVALGYSASAGQRQTELIERLSVECDLLAHVQFIVPIQYGSAEVQRAVEAACQVANAACGSRTFVTIPDFYDVHQSAVLRLATDVLVNHSVSDAFSGTVLETIYAGNLVFAARHLPYQSMPGAGSSIWFYDRAEDLVEMLSAPSLQGSRRVASATVTATRGAVEAIASWNGVIPSWRRLIGEVDGPGSRWSAQNPQRLKPPPAGGYDLP